MWLSMIENPDGLKAVLNGYIPNLENIELREIKIDYGGDVDVSVTFDIGGLKDNFPKKWLANEFNTLQITLSLASTNFVSLYHENLFKNKGSLIINNNVDIKSINFVIDTEFNIFEINAKWIYINGISGYKKNKVM